MTVPLAARLEALRSLAEVDPKALPVGINSITMTADGVPGIVRPPRASRLNFLAGGLPFHAAISPGENDGAVVQVWAEVGHIPYTAQSPERRRQALQLLRAIDGLKQAQFVVQGGQKVLLFRERLSDGPVTFEDIVHDAIVMLHEARPFLRLLAEHL